MKKLFAVVRSRGPAWDSSRPIEGQREWQAHAEFMNGLEAEGVVLVGGPLETMADFLLIMQAEDKSEIRFRLAADPWSRSGLLSLKQAVAWTVRLGGFGPTLTPTVSYDNAARGIRWLTDVLGFSPGPVFDGPEGGVVFAQLVWRTDVVFVSARPPAGTPWAEVGPASIALAVEDARAVDRRYQHAVAAGAEIVRPPHCARTPLFPDGSQQFDVRDPEGNLWTVGTFRPRIPFSS
jgi:uncharacterized glyoxalase superfamily protein PhnB/uncharacterized protein YciI